MDKVRNEYQLKLMRDKKRKEELAKKNAELDKIVLSEKEIKAILSAIRSRKYPVLQNFDICTKLQKMRLIRKPDAIETASSFNFPFYLTEKGKKLIYSK